MLFLLPQIGIEGVVLLTIAFILAIAVHEGNHAFVATALGDDTPRRAGRLTLNPLKHVDRTGILMFVIAGFGWGSTPVNPWNLRPNPRLGNAIVAAAGPLANLALALVASMLWKADLGWGLIVQHFLIAAASLNLLLFVFNLIPIPPLDGFSVLVGILPRDLAAQVRRIEPYGFPLLLALVFLLPYFGFNPVSRLLTLASTTFGIPRL